MFKKTLLWVGVSIVVWRSNHDPHPRNKLVPEHFNKDVNDHCVLLAP